MVAWLVTHYLVASEPTSDGGDPSYLVRIPSPDFFFPGSAARETRDKGQKIGAVAAPGGAHSLVNNASKMHQL